MQPNQQHCSVYGEDSFAEIRVQKFSQFRSQVVNLERLFPDGSEFKSYVIEL